MQPDRFAREIVPFLTLSNTARLQRLMRKTLDRVLTYQDKRGIISCQRRCIRLRSDASERADQKETAPMQLPHYYLPRPPLDLDAPTIAAFEALWTQISSSPYPDELSYHLPLPRWQFLCYLAEQKPVVLHGSGNPDLSEIEPRQTNDVSEFGNRCAIYAASDGIWPIYFAILDREQYPMSLTNACFRVITPGGTPSEPFYFFSISQAALQHQPWRTGTIYILPSTNFEQQALMTTPDADIQILQCASPERVRPLAKLAVRPDDFPFLKQIRGHDDTVQWQRASANPDGFPWIEDEAEPSR